MAIVTGTLEVQFDEATLTQSIAVEVDAVSVGPQSVLTPSELWSIVLDLPAQIAQWGAVTGIEWTVEVTPTVVGLPSSAWMLGGAALVMFAVVRRQ